MNELKNTFNKYCLMILENVKIVKTNQNNFNQTFCIQTNIDNCDKRIFFSVKKINYFFYYTSKIKIILFNSTVFTTCTTSSEMKMRMDVSANDEYEFETILDT